MYCNTSYNQTSTFCHLLFAWLKKDPVNSNTPSVYHNPLPFVFQEEITDTAILCQRWDLSSLPMGPLSKRVICLAWLVSWIFMLWCAICLECRRLIMMAISATSNTYWLALLPGMKLNGTNYVTHQNRSGKNRDLDNSRACQSGCVFYASSCRLKRCSAKHNAYMYTMLCILHVREVKHISDTKWNKTFCFENFSFSREYNIEHVECMLLLWILYNHDKVVYKYCAGTCACMLPTNFWFWKSAHNVATDLKVGVRVVPVYIKYAGICNSQYYRNSLSLTDPFLLCKQQIFALMSVIFLRNF